MLVRAGKEVGETDFIMLEEPVRLLSLVILAAGQEACIFPTMHNFTVPMCYLNVEFNGTFSAK